MTNADHPLEGGPLSKFVLDYGRLAMMFAASHEIDPGNESAYKARMDEARQTLLDGCERLTADLAQLRADRKALIEGKIWKREDIDGDYWLAEGVFEPLTQMPPLIRRFTTVDEALAAYRAARSGAGGLR